MGYKRQNLLSILTVLCTICVAANAQTSNDPDDIIDKMVLKVMQSNGKLESAVNSNEIKKLYRSFKNKYRPNNKLQSSQSGNIKEFENNVKKIILNNLKFENNTISFKTGLNQYTDMTLDERFKYTGLMLPKSQSNVTYFKPPKVDKAKLTAASVDWTRYCPPIENQDQCGSCWAFGGAAVVEALYGKKSGQPVSVSKQELVDCVPMTESSGCSGGFMDSVLKMAKNQGLTETRSYPYTAKDGCCRRSSRQPAVKISSYNKVNKKDVINALATSPVTIGISLGEPFFAYRSGVLDDRQCMGYNGQAHAAGHAVTVVGHGTENGKQYLKIRNSWGNTWGENGYLKYALDTFYTCDLDLSYIATI
ncbi:hypothetical protein GJ496_010420 [Pomphorhynchus laevis]|nr:hypothetical protein GJ496_010420 [Pomphorhynchus laevis]